MGGILYPSEAMNMRISTTILCAGLLLAGQSFADDIEKAKKEMAAGGKDFVGGNCKSALIHFNAASNYAPEAAGPHRELGKTLECLEKYDEAKREYETYLQMKPDAPDADEIKGYIVGVEKRIAEITPDSAVNSPTVTNGKLTFEVDKGAKISVDGKSLGKDQLKGYSLAPGKYTIRIEKKGFEPIIKDVDIEEGKTVAINESLVASSKEGPETPTTDGPKRSKIPAVASFVVAAGGIGLGVFAGLQALKLNDELADLQDQPIPQDEFDDFVKQGENFNLLTIVGYSVAGAAAGAGVFLLIRSGKPAAGEAEAKKLQVMPSIGGFSAKISF
jgi:hypothetical protein